MSLKTVAVIGLGYVGLPLAISFGQRYRTIGFDVSGNKISSYLQNIDSTGEISCELFQKALHLEFTTDPRLLQEADVLIIAVPTPVNKANFPDFSCLVSASEIVGKNLKKGSIVVYESTVYPGATEEICIPILEKNSGLKWKKDFNVGYSPERVNPGDKERTIEKIVKVVSGDSPESLNSIATIYGSIISAGIYQAPSIKVAEAAKVIENTQRDLNIALMNELAIIFDLVGIDTLEVLKAAGTKWNFLPFRPGLVGGHCIGIDPYYLTYKAEMLGYHPQVILSGRKINDGISKFIAQQTIKHLLRIKGIQKGEKIIVLGLTFKENCSDLRNSKVADLIRELEDYGCKVFVHDPIASPEEAENEYGIKLSVWDDLPVVAAMIGAVSHESYLKFPVEKLLSKLEPNGIFIDVKSTYNSDKIIKAGRFVWRL